MADVAADGKPGNLVALSVANWLMLTGQQQPADSPQVLFALHQLWSDRASGGITLGEVARRAMTDATVLGSISWPAAFVTSVASAMEVIESLGAPETLRASLQR